MNKFISIVMYILLTFFLEGFFLICLEQIRFMLHQLGNGYIIWFINLVSFKKSSFAFFIF